MLKRKARPTSEAAAAQAAAAQSGPLSVRHQFESRMAQQEELATVATAEPSSSRTHKLPKGRSSSSSSSGGGGGAGATYLTLAPSSRATVPAPAAATASRAAGGCGAAALGSLPGAAVEEATYSYFGDDDFSWMYDRKAVEIVHPPAASVDDNEAYCTPLTGRISSNSQAPSVLHISTLLTCRPSLDSRSSRRHVLLILELWSEDWVLPSDQASAGLSGFELSIYGVGPCHTCRVTKIFARISCRKVNINRNED